MADKTILELTSIGSLNGTEKIPAARPGESSDGSTGPWGILQFVQGEKLTSQASTYTLTPNDRDKMVVCGELSALTIALPQANNVPTPKATVATIEFTSGATATVLTYDSSEISFVGGEIPDIVANARYLISVWYDTAVCAFLNTVTNP
jgi:hypothetical protein